MDPVLQSLIRYQELSLELSRLNARLKEYPIQLKAIEAELAKLSGAVAAARSAVSDHQKDQRKLQAELQDLEAKLKKYNEQLMQVKTNDEYRAMQHEIAGVKQKVGAVEEKILLLMEEADTADARVKEEEKRLTASKMDSEGRVKVVQEEQRALEEEATRVSAAQQAFRQELGADVLDLFNRIAQGRNGIAMARAREERCQECNVRLRPQVFQEIKRNDHIVQCDSCMRILYYVAEPPAGGGPGEPSGDAASGQGTAREAAPDGAAPDDAAPDDATPGRDGASAGAGA